jgi:Ser/Thr protein kinase RdoA (MazF antagonist)
VFQILGEAAIAAAYAILGKEDPLALAKEIVRGFHSAFPLNEAEIACREALRIQKELLGNSHPNLAKSLSILGLVLETEGKLAGAEAAEREALAMQRQLLAREHPDIAWQIMGTMARRIADSPPAE